MVVDWRCTRPLRPPRENVKKNNSLYDSRRRVNDLQQSDEKCFYLHTKKQSKYDINANALRGIRERKGRNLSDDRRIEK